MNIENVVKPGFLKRGNLPAKVLTVCNKGSNIVELLLQLPQEDYSVEKVQGKDSEEIAEIVQMVNPDIVFLDLSSYSETDNMVICKSIKNNDETKEVQLVIFGEYGDDSLAARYLEIGVDDFLSRHPESTEVLVKIRNSLQAREYDVIKRDYRMLNDLFQQVQNAKAEWEQSMDCLEDIVMLTDLDGRLVRCNKMLTAITGKRFVELLGSTFNEIVRENGFVCGTAAEDQAEVVHSGGTRFHLHCNDVKDGDGVIFARVVYLHNITKAWQLRKDVQNKSDEVMEAYTRLIEAQGQVRRQRRMASMGELMAGIAHEINSPLGFILSNMDTLARYVDKMITFQQLQSNALDEISGGGDVAAIVDGIARERERLKLDRVVEDIGCVINESNGGAKKVQELARNMNVYSRSDAESFEPADINAGLDCAVNMVWHELRHKGKLKTDYADLPKIECSIGQLSQVFINLLMNAAQSIMKWGEITIKTWLQDDHVCISISDTGEGMTEEVRERLFEPYFTTKEAGKGTGLGLSITNDIIKTHKGEILVDSAIGKGSTFTIKIPVTGGG